MPSALLAALQVERETVVPRKVVERPRHAVPLEVAWRRADHAPIRGELDRDEIGIDRAADPYTHVESKAYEIDDLIGKAKRRAHFGILRDERWRMRRDMLASECGGRRHDEVSGGAVTPAIQKRFDLIEIREQTPALLEIGGAFLGQRESPRRAMQKAHAEPALEGVDAAADHDWGHLRLERRLGEAAAVGRGDESFDLLQLVHGTYSILKVWNE